MSTVDLSDPGSSERTRVRRAPDRAVTDREGLHRVLDAALIAHVAVRDDDGQPYVIPVAFARRGDEVVIHGSTGSRLFRALAAGQPTCLTVTQLDGLVVARSAFESSMNYRSAMVIGVTRRLEGDDQLDALRAITEHLMPGRWADCRQPTRKERAATVVLALSLDECSVKVRTGGPEDDPDDVTDSALVRIWSGVVPIAESFGPPLPADDVSPDAKVPSYISTWTRR